MTILYSSNFDTDTAGQLPSGWANVVGTWQTSTTDPVSSPNALRNTSSTDGDMVLYNAVTLADGTFRHSAKYKGTPAFPGLLFRGDSGFANGYAFLIVPGAGTALFFKRVGGGFTPINTNISISANLSGLTTGDVVTSEVSFVGSTIELRVWRAATSRPSTPSYSVSDSTFTGAGRCGVYMANENNAAPTNSFDDVVISDTSTPPAGTTIARNASGVFYAPGAWADNGTSANANSTGAYLKTVFTGTSLAVNIVALSGLTAYPVVRAYIDDLPAIDVQITNGMTQMVFASGSLTSGSHRLRLVVAKINEETGCWTLANAVKITGLVLDSGGTASAPSLRSKRAIFYGDSLIQGVRVRGTTPVYPDGMDGTLSVAPLIAEALDAEVAQIGYGGQGYAQAGASGVPQLADAFSLYSSGVSRLTSGVSTITYDYVLNMHGTNGSVSQANVAANITALRAAHPSAWLIYIVPPGGFSRAAITAAVNAAITGGDRKVVLIDAGSGQYQAGLNGSIGAANEQSADQVHPWARTNARLAAEYTRQIQHAIEPRRFTVVAA